MDLILQSPRLLLRPLSHDDIDISIKMFTDPDAVKYVCDVMTEVEIIAEMPRWLRRGGNGCIGIWCVTDRITAEKLGSVFFLPLPIEGDDTDHESIVEGEMPTDEIECGYFLKKSAWGNGYATEACKRLLEFGFTHSPLHEIVATLDDDHVVSKRVLEKCGFTYRGRMRCFGTDNMPRYTITREEWRI